MLGKSVQTTYKRNAELEVDSQEPSDSARVRVSVWLAVHPCTLWCSWPSGKPSCSGSGPVWRTGLAGHGSGLVAVSRAVLALSDCINKWAQP